MKVASFNVKGLSDSHKLRALWTWLLALDLDIVCIQEHKLHHFAGTNHYFKGYTLFYGGIQGGYSGTLLAVKNYLLSCKLIMIQVILLLFKYSLPLGLFSL